MYFITLYVVKRSGEREYQNWLTEEFPPIAVKKFIEQLKEYPVKQQPIDVKLVTFQRFYDSDEMKIKWLKHNFDYLENN